MYPQLDEFFISQLLSQEQKSLQIAKGHFEKPQAQIFENLREAIECKHILQFDYALKPRIVKPYRLLHIEGVWYLLASQSGKLKHFTLSKIQNLIDTKKPFIPSQKVAKLLKSNYNSTTYFTPTPKTAQILLLTPKARTHFLRKNLPPNFCVLKDSYENLTLEMRYAFDDEVLNFVKSWLPHAQIISPIKLHKKLQKMLAEYIRTTNAVATKE
ncbi:WYL domain-containing protein [Helicobacter macacae]|uniref:WYL domain-containing protein n=1 Tax=Helicobacter macacae MIT 99-5501 TaxID=1357400 RepID=V8C8Z4_9HELI|nr:WYL domain-containing protein [Helicobacter macacae]ETD23542.1 hypothetical protein HMPREF2086_01347 [Helicobacter macacae MIT 99-5501]